MPCLRCGKCCQERAGNDTWKQGAVPADFEIKRMNKKGCHALIFVDEVAVCLIENEFGYKAKPDVCKEYLDKSLCPK